MTLEMNLSTLIEEFNEYQRKFQESAQEKLKECFSQFWELNPGITAVNWTQYTPYFNDGEPCYFSICGPNFTNVPVEEVSDITYWGEYDGEREGVWCRDGFRHLNADEIPQGVDVKSTYELSTFLNCDAMEPVMRATFGEDSAVVATRAGFEISDHSGNHD